MKVHSRGNDEFHWFYSHIWRISISAFSLLVIYPLITNYTWQRGMFKLFCKCIKGTFFQSKVNSVFLNMWNSEIVFYKTCYCFQKSFEKNVKNLMDILHSRNKALKGRREAHDLFNVVHKLIFKKCDCCKVVLSRKLCFQFCTQICCKSQLKCMVSLVWVLEILRMFLEKFLLLPEDNCISIKN